MIGDVRDPIVCWLQNPLNPIHISPESLFLVVSLRGLWKKVQMIDGCLEGYTSQIVSPERTYLGCLVIGPSRMIISIGVTEYGMKISCTGIGIVAVNALYWHVWGWLIWKFRVQELALSRWMLCTGMSEDDFTCLMIGYDPSDIGSVYDFETHASMIDLSFGEVSGRITSATNTTSSSIRWSMPYCFVLDVIASVIGWLKVISDQWWSCDGCGGFAWFSPFEAHIHLMTFG